MSGAARWMGVPGAIALRLLTRVPAIALVVTFLVCSAPGFYSDERLLDPNLSQGTLRKIEAERGAAGNPLRKSVEYLAGVAKGELGYSPTFQRPVSELLRDRAAVTFPSSLAAIAAGWTGALVFALGGTGLRSHPVAQIPASATAAIVCIPAALLGFLAAVARAPVAAALALLVFARVYTYADRLLAEALLQPHALAARAYGASRPRILAVHILPGLLPQLLAVMAASVTLVLGAAVPVETICDVPGLGQLAWKATISRDLPLLLGITLIVSTCSIAAATVSDVSGGERRPGAA